MSGHSLSESCMDTAQPTEGLTGSYARWRSSRLGQITDALEQQLLIELLGPVADRKLLDVGCSDGALASELARRGAIVTGLDADPAMIAAAKRRTEIEATQLHLVEGHAERLPFDDVVFDFVVAVTVLCFVRDAERAVMQMARVLRPGGRLVIGDLGRWNLWAVHRRIRGWLGDPDLVRSRVPHEAELRGLVYAAGLMWSKYAEPCIIRRTGSRRGFLPRSIYGSVGERLSDQPLLPCQQRSLSKRAGAKNHQDHASERNKNVADSVAQALRRVIRLHAREPTARGASPEGSVRQPRSRNLRSRPGWRHRATLTRCGTCRASSRLGLLSHRSLCLSARGARIRHRGLCGRRLVRRPCRRRTLCLGLPISRQYDFGWPDPSSASATLFHRHRSRASRRRHELSLLAAVRLQ